jgi:hypothetical protein
MLHHRKRDPGKCLVLIGVDSGRALWSSVAVTIINQHPVIGILSSDRNVKKQEQGQTVGIDT